jgi:hypothetical protein
MILSLLKERQKKGYADLITYINCLQVFHSTDQKTTSSYSRIKSQRKNSFFVETNDVHATGNVKGFTKTGQRSDEDNTSLNNYLADLRAVSQNADRLYQQCQFQVTSQSY